jgi:hypothetical protein
VLNSLPVGRSVSLDQAAAAAARLAPHHLQPHQGRAIATVSSRRLPASARRVPSGLRTSIVGSFQEPRPMFTPPASCALEPESRAACTRRPRLWISEVADRDVGPAVRGPEAEDRGRRYRPTSVILTAKPSRCERGGGAAQPSGSPRGWPLVPRWKCRRAPCPAWPTTRPIDQLSGNSVVRSIDDRQQRGDRRDAAASGQLGAKAAG